MNYDGTDVVVKCLKDNTDAPTGGEWSGASACFTSDQFDGLGGQFGFAGNQSIAWIDDLTVKADRDDNGSFETTELVEDFADGVNGADAEPTYDAAGNMTYDGIFAYTYDAWNRQVKVTKAYRDPGSPSTVALGSVISVSEYDGMSRRIVKAVQNSGDLDCTYHYYHRGQSVVEERNGSDMVIKQYVWAPETGYIDELVQTTINGDPIDDPEMDPVDPDHDARKYYTLHNANYNVMALGDDSGVLVERYEYTPYGERQVYVSAGANDPLAMTPAPYSRRVTLAGSVDAPYGLLEIGHQGLYHDQESGLVYNRARILHTDLSWLQREPLGYIDGMNLYQYVKSNPTNFFDPSGQQTDSPKRTGDHRADAYRRRVYNQIKSKLESACTDTCIDNCKNDCDKKTCKQEAAQIARAYQDAIRRPALPNFMKPWDWWTDYRGGKLCYEWRDTTWNAVSPLQGNFKCFKIAAGGYADKGGSTTYHNWVNVTVGNKPAPSGDCTRRLDPWQTGGQYPGVYDDQTHGYPGNVVGLPTTPGSPGAASGCKFIGDYCENGICYPDMWSVEK